MAQFLVIQLARFGDLVQSKRLVRSLEGRGAVHLCIDASLAGVAALIYPKAVLHCLPAHGRPDAAGAALVRSTLAELADADFDAVYNLNHAGVNRALARLFAPDQVRGHSMHGDQPLRSPWVRMAFRWTGHRPLAPVNLVDYWAWFDAQPCAPMAVNPPARGGGAGLGIVLAGRESRRSLPPPVLAQITRTAFETMGGPPLFLLGSATEKILARQLLRHLPGNMLDRVQDLCGKTDWSGLAQALTGLDTLISPDTGTMHLAAHLGVPVQAFFLSSAWCHETGPYGQGHRVWQSVHPCAPCLEASPCPVNALCLDDFLHRAIYKGLTLDLGAAQQQVSNLALPPGLTLQESCLDALGTRWQVRAGLDPSAERRAQLRALVAEYLGCPVEESVYKNTELAHFIYDETDWMLPHRSSHCLEI